MKKIKEILTRFWNWIARESSPKKITPKKKVATSKKKDKPATKKVTRKKK